MQYHSRMNPRVYVETSVISYLTAWPSRDLVVAAHQQITRQWWERERVHYDLFISAAVLREASAGDARAAAERMSLLENLPLLTITAEVEGLAKDFLEAGAMPPTSVLDALHVAVAAWHGAEYVLTWNCRHIASARVRPRVEALCRSRGIAPPQLCTPEELMED